MFELKEFQLNLSKYITKIKSVSNNATELSYRTYLHNFLESIVSQHFSIMHEARMEYFGRPDFKITKAELAVGYLETKKVGALLSSYMSSPQLTCYTNAIHNFILTNYEEFVLFNNGNPVLQANIYNDYRLLQFINADIQYTSLEALLLNFFNQSANKISSPQELSLLLAEKSKVLREGLLSHTESVKDNLQFTKRLDALFQLFKNTLISEISFSQFIDIYVQTLVYGLFMSKLNSTQPIHKQTAISLIPSYLSVVEEIFELIKITSIPIDISWIIDDIVDTLNNINIESFKQNMAFSRQIDEDPYIYFYEHFLKTYNKQEREIRGVYYTPRPIVSFIINSVNKLLTNNYNKSGLSDDGITLLDFSTGTGTFLLEAFRKVLTSVDSALKNKYIEERLLKNFFGFECQVAPYVIAHLKLYNFLLEENFSFTGRHGIGVYLTDTLNNEIFIENSLYPAITQESNNAWEIKSNKNILVIIGNPPYNDHSHNNSSFIDNLMDEYKKDLNERKHHLNDDYLKFIRFAQWKIESQNNGVIGIITNNSYLDGIIHRIMRKSLFNTFDNVYILNLHGNADKKEKGENVFDIRVGVSIVFFIKSSSILNPKEKHIYYYSTNENNILSRNDKYKLLLDNDISTIAWKEIFPNSPNYWFTDKPQNISSEYNNGWSLTDIFRTYVSGIIPAKDKFVIHKYQDNVIDIICDILDLTESELVMKYSISDSRDWTIARVKIFIKSDLENLLNKKINNSLELSDEDKKCIKEKRILKIHYKVFDYRYTYYYDQYGGFLLCPRYKIMKNFIHGNNLGLVCVRQVAEDNGFNHCLVTENIVSSRISVSNRGGAFVFPLYLNTNDSSTILEGLSLATQVDNFTEKFKKFINSYYKTSLKPEEIVSYIYAILNSNKYTNRYIEYLKTDFPRIIFVENINLFKTLSLLGHQLILLQTFKTKIQETSLPSFNGTGTFKVEKPVFINNKLYINKTQYFHYISDDAWNLQICGYRVLDKFLSERKSIILKLDEVDYIKKFAAILENTILIKKQIDEVVQKINI